MFKKKKETKQETKAIDKSEPLFYDDMIIRAAIKCVNDALKTGQIVNEYSNSDPVLVVGSICESYGRQEGYIQHYGSQFWPILDTMKIKTEEQIKEEKREEKQKELERLQKCQAKDLENIERLARELGNK